MWSESINDIKTRVGTGIPVGPVYNGSRHMEKDNLNMSQVVKFRAIYSVKRAEFNHARKI